MREVKLRAVRRIGFERAPPVGVRVGGVNLPPLLSRRVESFAWDGGALRRMLLLGLGLSGLLCSDGGGIGKGFAQETKAGAGSGGAGAAVEKPGAQDSKGVQGVAAQKEAARGLLRQLDEGFAAMFEEVAPVVVVIDARRAGHEGSERREGLDKDLGKNLREAEDAAPSKPGREGWSSLQPEVISQGSGFIVRADGYILTNQHVVAGAESLEVRLRDGRRLVARVVAVDAVTDIAVIKVEAQGLPSARWADSERVRVGQLVGAIGVPYSQEYSFTCGWISGKGRTNLLGPSSSAVLHEDYLQTDAFINPGNSGGPLFDVEGRVVGMNTLINGVARGLAFAIPSKVLQEVVGQLIEKGRVQRAWLGIRVKALEEERELRARVPEDVAGGVVVSTIEEGTPAFRSGLRVADIIVEADGVKVGTVRDLQQRVLAKGVGQAMVLRVWRGGSFLKVSVQTGELPVDQSGGTSDGVGGMILRVGKGSGARVVVEEVRAGSAAARAGVEAGDVVVEVDGKGVGDVAAFGEMFRQWEARGGGRMGLGIERKGKRAFAIFEKVR